jgi:glycosyltransferase involved in cell wall biosynthesis
MHAKIEFLISTMNRSSIDFINDMFCHTGIENINAVVINQCPDILPPNNIPTPHPGIKVISVKDKGLALSRNRAIKHATGDICLFTDDDVVYLPESLTDIERNFNQFKEADIITFKAQTKDGIPFKKYKNTPFIHNRRTITKISSIEIGIRRSFLRKSKIFFDERFGLGSRYNSGEENIFVMDAFRRGLKIYYVPVTIVEHAFESSGKIINKTSLFGKGAVYRRLFGAKAAIYNLAFVFFKRRLISKSNISIPYALKLIFKGYFDLGKQ